MQSPNSPYQQFSITSILSRAFAILLQNPVLFMGLTLLAFVPSMIIRSLWGGSQPADLVASILETVLTLMASGALAFAVYQILRGFRTDFGEALSHGWARALPLFLVSLLSGLGIALGMMLLIIPGVILACIWAVAIQACVVEGLGPIESLQRSMDLTSGYRMTIFLIELVVALIIVGLDMLLGLLFAGNPGLLAVLVACVGVVVQAFNNILLSVIYFDLREIKDGVSLDALTFE